MLPFFGYTHRALVVAVISKTKSKVKGRTQNPAGRKHGAMVGPYPETEAGTGSIRWAGNRSGNHYQVLKRPLIDPASMSNRFSFVRFTLRFPSEIVQNAGSGGVLPL